MMWHKCANFISYFSIKAGNKLQLCFVVAWQQNNFFSMKSSTLGCCQVSLMAFNRLDLWKVAGFFPLLCWWYCSDWYLQCLNLSIHRVVLWAETGTIRWLKCQGFFFRSHFHGGHLSPLRKCTYNIVLYTGYRLIAGIFRFCILYI